MKNLIIIQMESLSEHLYQVFNKEMPFLKYLRDNSIDYTNSFSSATSTDMSRIGLFMANDRLYDYIQMFNQKDVDFDSCDSIFTVLHDTSYKTLGLAYSEELNFKDYANYWHVWSSRLGAPLGHVNDEKTLFSKFESFITKDSSKPFVFYFHNLYSHIRYGKNIKQNYDTFYESHAAGFRHMDDFIKKIYDQLDEYGILDNTLLVFWGDHGDDFETHGYSPVSVHGLIPYSSQIHVPFFMYQKNKIKPEKNTNLHSTSEGAKLILEQLGVDSKCFDNPQNIIYDKEIGKIIFAQNRFTNQKPIMLIDKGFAAISNNYLLLVSNQGMEMYDWRVDPTNHNNLLLYFDLKNENLHLKDLGEYPIPGAMLSPPIVECFCKEFSILRQALIDYIADKEIALGAKLKNPFPRKFFSQIRKGKKLCNYDRLEHIKFFRMKIQLGYYLRLLKSDGIKAILLRGWQRVLRLGKKQNRGW